MPKTLKVRGEASRLALIELLVEKRVRFLDYLRDLHRIGGGVLWMGTVRLTRQDVSQYFQPFPPNKVIPLQFHLQLEEGEAEVQATMNSPSSNATSMRNRSTFESAEASSGEMVVTLSNLGAFMDVVGAAWLCTHLPIYTSLAVSLAELLPAPLTGTDFVESLYALLLEMDVRFASGITGKTLALRNLRNYRQQATWLIDKLIEGGSTLNSATELDGQVRYLFLNTDHLSYTPSPETLVYESVLVPLCAQLTMVYRRLGDYDVACAEESAKRILSIDRRLQELFFAVIGKELGKLARCKLMQQTAFLTTDGLFAGFGDGTRGSASNLLQDMFQQQQQQQRGSTGGNPAEEGGGGAAAAMLDSDDEAYEEEL